MMKQTSRVGPLPDSPTPDAKAYVAPLTRRVVFFTFVCAMTTADYLSKGSTFLGPYVQTYANESLTRRYGHHFATPATMRWVRSVTVSLRGFSPLFGAVLLTYVMEKCGRRATGMLLANGLMILAAILQIVCVYYDRYELYMAGQFVQGLGSAFAPALTLLMGESAPDRFRGIASMLVNTGGYALSTFATIMAFVWIFGNESRWQYFPIVGIIFALPQLLTYKYFPESPKFLYIVRNDVKKARQSIRFYHGKRVDADELFVQYDREAYLSLTTQTSSLWEIVSTRHLRIPFMLCWVATMAGTVSGNTIKGAYINELFVSFGVPKEYSNVPVLFIYSISTVFGIYVSLSLIERVGRRPLFLASMVVDMFGIMLMLLADVYAPSRRSAVFGATGTLMLTFGVMLGLYKLPYLFIAEMCPQGARAITASVCFFSMNILSLAQSLLYPPTHPTLTYWSWAILFVAEFTCFLIMYNYLPETKGRSVGEIVEQWVDDHSQEQMYRARRKSTRANSEYAPLIASKRSIINK